MDDIIQVIKETVSIREVCDMLGIEILPSGFILCPFHEIELGRPDTNATNCYVYENTVHCHGCGRSGDIFDLYQVVENCDFLTAEKALAEYAGLEVGGNVSVKTYQPLTNEDLALLRFNRTSMQKVFDYSKKLYSDIVTKRCNELISIYEQAKEDYKSKKSSGADELYEICEVDGMLRTEDILKLNALFLAKIAKIQSIKEKVTY